MVRLVVLSISLALVMPAPLPAFAAAQADAAGEDGQPCKLSEPKKRGSRMLGGMLGSLAGRAFGSNPVSSIVSFNTVGETLTDAIACRLDKDEQKQAAKATNDAITRGVGSREQWQSETRENVSGSSTVTAKTQLADGSNCMNVTDVIIVNGEETTVPKKMCRKPGASGYSVAV